MIYFRSSSAALAIEECGPNYKAVFAKPKHDDGPSGYPPSYTRHGDSKSNFYIVVYNISSIFQIIRLIKFYYYFCCCFRSNK